MKRIFLFDIDARAILCLAATSPAPTVRRGAGALCGIASTPEGSSCVWRSDEYQVVRRAVPFPRALAGVDRAVLTSRRGGLGEYHHRPLFRPVAGVWIRRDELGRGRPNGDQPVQRVPDEGPQSQGERGEATREPRCRWRR